VRVCTSGTPRTCKGLFSAYTQALHGRDLPKEEIRVLSKTSPGLLFDLRSAGEALEDIKQMGLELELELILPIWHRSRCCRVKWGARVLRMRSVSREEVWASAGVQGAWVGGPQRRVTAGRG